MNTQKNKKSAFWLLLALVMILSFLIPNTADAYETRKIYTGTDGGVAVTRPTSEPPIAISFINHPNYSSSKLFYYETYRGKFNWFSPVPPDSMNPTNAQQDRRFIVENRIDNYGESSTSYFVNKNFSWNLKKGRQEPRIGRPAIYQGDNTGTTRITQAWTKGGVTYNYVGRNYEWRYLGYSADGNVVHNPYFPADYPSDPNSDYSKRNWIKNPDRNPLTRSLDMAQPSEYDADFNRKVQWFKDYFFVNNPNFRRSNMSLDADARHWASVFMLQTRPDWETGIVVGFHNLNGRIYYINLEMASPALPNLRLVTYSLIDDETGKVVATARRNGTHNENTAVTVTRHESSVVAGRAYRVEAQVKNMTHSRLNGRTTRFTPLGLDVRYSWDATAQTESSWNVEALSTSREKGAARAASTSINYGSVMNYKSMLRTNNSNATEGWRFTVPNSARSIMKFSAAIPMGHFLRGDNYQTDDDVFTFTMPVIADDIATSANVEIYRDGKLVSDIAANEVHTIRYFVNKAYGNRAVGSNSPTNPYASLRLVVSDGETTRTLTKATNVVLRKAGDTAMIEYRFVPSRPYLSTTWRIDPKHALPSINQSTDLSNDGPYSKEWTGLMNLKVTDVKASPDVLRVGVGETQTASQEVQLNYKILMETTENNPKSVTVRVRRGNTVVQTFNAIALPNRAVQLSTVIPARSYGIGTQDFSVEVNPVPRGIVEYLPSGLNPYTDNIGTAEMTVSRGEGVQRCSTVRTQNTWNQRYTIDNWEGEDETYFVWVTDYSRPSTCWDFNYDSNGSRVWYSYTCYPHDRQEARQRIATKRAWTTNENVSHFERYTIDQILVRTKETNGSWVNVKGNTARVQAGYGFEIRPVVRYDTNLLTARPTSTNGSYSRKTVSPGSGLVESPNQVYMERPSFGQPSRRVTDVLDRPTRAGDIGSHRKTYELPEIRVDGLDVHEIVIPSDTRPGTHSFRFDTPAFYGSTQKPSQSQMLCDTGTFTLQVLPNDVNDVDTHITQ